MTAGGLVAAVAARCLAATDEADLLSGLHEVLAERGLDLLRISFGAFVLSPTEDLVMRAWTRGQGLSALAADTRAVAPQDLERHSPFAAMRLNRTPELRRRLERLESGDIDFFAVLAMSGATDFFALGYPTPVERLPGGDGVAISFVADRPGGFSDAEIELLREIGPVVALGVALATAAASGRNALATYLGGAAARQVLAGNIVRGRAEPLRAVVWSSDLVGFTKLSDELPTPDVLELLNDYAGALVGAVEAQGGEVLKFIGDGLLAVFPERAGASAAEAALAATLAADAAVAALNAGRAATGRPVTAFYVGLHVGELLFGNFGSPARLDFTVLGPAVNEVTRMLSLSKGLDRRVLASEAFVAALGEGRTRFVSAGRFALKGVRAPQHVFTLDEAWSEARG